MTAEVLNGFVAGITWRRDEAPLRFPSGGDTEEACDELRLSHRITPV
jgi:hypothetical protein